VQALTTNSSLGNCAGVTGFGTGWNTAYFDELTLDAAPVHPRLASSYLYDILPGEQTLSNLTGWAGLALDLTESPKCAPSLGVQQRALSVVALGRFLSSGNKDVHMMDIRRASDGSSLLQSPAFVNMSSCSSDILGFCYSTTFSTPVTLTVGDTYYIVSQESAGADSLREMVNPARGTVHANGRRDGTTSMTYVGPNAGCVAGRVFAPAGQPSLQWTVTPDLDTAFGPVNFLLAD
jgi:hypothetical protein